MFSGLSVFGQSPIFKSTFNDGNNAEDLVMGFDGIKLGTSRTCGMVDFGRAFDGASSITYPEEVVEYLRSEFTLSFYLQVENDDNAGEVVNIISARESCDREQAFSITYFPVDRTLQAEYWTNNQQTIVSAILSENICWHHVVIVFDIADLKLYVNGTLEQSSMNALSTPFMIGPTATFAVSGGPCIGLSEIELEGKIDELCIYDAVLDERQVQGLDLQPDRILTKDTSIFAGGAVPIETGPICTSDFDWFPTRGISSTNSVDPIITPNETTTYQLETDYGFCRSVDSITITVIDPETVMCEELRLPTAFTPNDDLLNDDFGISNPILIEDLKSFEIFDKWGAKMFETTDRNGRWDGRFLGDIPNTNTFLYRINYTCKGQEFFKSGSFTILR